MNFRWIMFSVLCIATIARYSGSTDDLIYSVCCILLLGFLFQMFYLDELIEEIKKLNKPPKE